MERDMRNIIKAVYYVAAPFNAAIVFIALLAGNTDSAIFFMAAAVYCEIASRASVETRG